MSAQTIVILTSDSKYNLADYFHRQVAAAFEAAGKEVRLVDFSTADWASALQTALNAAPDLVFTADPSLLALKRVNNKSLCDLFSTPIAVYYLWRHPVHDLDTLLPPHPRMAPIATDENHAQFLRQLAAHNRAEQSWLRIGYFPCPAFVMPPAPAEPNSSQRSALGNRPIPVLFFGAVAEPQRFQQRWQEHLPREEAALLDQIAAHCAQTPAAMPEELLEATFRRFGKNIWREPDFLSFCLGNLEAYVTHFRRLVILQTLQEIGMPIQIYCDHPVLLQQIPEADAAAVHPAADFEDIAELCRQSRVVLSIQPMLRSGISPRMAAAIGGGAAVVSDRQTWLEAHFPDGRAMSYYQSNAAEEAAAAIGKLLRRPAFCTEMAAAAQARFLEPFSLTNFTNYVMELAAGETTSHAENSGGYFRRLFRKRS